MKKMNVLLAALTFAVAAITPMTSSADSYENKDKASVDLSIEYESGYTMVIPSDPVDLSGEGNTKNLSLKLYAFLEYDDKLTMSVTSEQTKGDKWILQDVEHPENFIEYTMEADFFGDITPEKNTVLSFSADDNFFEFNETTLHVTAPDEVKYAGTYSSTLTFTITPGTVNREDTIR